MAGVAGVRLRLEKTVVLVGESITASGEISPPLPMLDVKILIDSEVANVGKTDYLGRFSIPITLSKVGEFKVTAVCAGVSSDPVPLTVRPVAPPAPPPAPTYVAPAVVTAKLSEITVDDFTRLLRGLLEEAFGISEVYDFRQGILEPNSSKEFDIEKVLGRPALEGYVINDHDTESLWLYVNNGPLIEVKPGEVYPLYKRKARKLKIENKSATVSVPYRLEVR
jgi:hypothetical protein